MKKTMVIIISAISFWGYSQTSVMKTTTFHDFVKLFSEQKMPSKYKTGIINDVNKISKSDAINYFYLTEDDLRMNDYNYDYDEDIQYDNWIDVLPGALGKFSNEKYIALVYALLKAPTNGLETYKASLITFTYDGEIIDSIVVRHQYTREEDWKDVVFLENNMLRIFDYRINSENYTMKRGSYYIIDNEQPKTVVEIVDYQINETGEIKLIKEHTKKYLMEPVSFYRNYHAESDDPMNEYK